MNWSKFHNCKIDIPWLMLNIKVVKKLENHFLQYVKWTPDKHGEITVLPEISWSVLRMIQMINSESIGQSMLSYFGFGMTDFEWTKPNDCFKLKKYIWLKELFYLYYWSPDEDLNGLKSIKIKIKSNNARFQMPEEAFSTSQWSVGGNRSQKMIFF